MAFSFPPAALIFPAVLLIALILVLTVKRRSEYTKLDRVGIVTNVILSILYVPMSIMGVFMVMATDNPPEGAAGAAINALATVGACTPIVSVVGILACIILRRRGKSILSFVLQFVPLAIFLLMLLGFALIPANAY